MTGKFGPKFVPDLDEQEIFEAHVKNLKAPDDEGDLMWIIRFGHVSLLGFLEE